MAFDGGEALILGTATSLSTYLGITDPAKKACKQVLLQALGAASAFVGGSNVTTTANRRGVLLTTATLPFTIGTGDGETLNTDFIYVVGTAAGGNIVTIGLVS